MNDPATIVCFGEVLWDLLPSGKIAGGAPMNVAYHVNRMGLRAHMISRTGQDDLGREIRQFLETKGVDTQLIQYDPTFPTGVVKVTLDTRGQASYEILQPVAWDYIQPDVQAQEVVAAADVLVFGSLACRTDRTQQTLLELLELAVYSVFDVNLRPPFYSQELLAKLLPMADIVKMNDDELAVIGEWFTSGADEKSRMEGLLQKFNLQGIVVTKGKDGAAFLDADGFYSHPGFAVTVEDTVGSGDAFLAAFLKKRLEGRSPQECLEYACATGALVATHKGGTPAFSPDAVSQFLNNRK